MTGVPVAPKIYHITHLDNLAAILSAGGLYADAGMRAAGGPPSPIGLPDIKARRLSLAVRCHAGSTVGEYVPFYFCPRSIMLYILHRGNLPGLTYRGGQVPILHLEADLHRVVEWAETTGHRWTFTPSNAGATYTQFYADLQNLDQINWEAVASTDFRDPAVKEGKQAEFLLHAEFAWHLVERIGVYSDAIKAQVLRTLHDHAHRPTVEVRRTWYY